MHGHSHHDGARALGWATVLNLAYTVLEAGYGFATNSLALLSDALHNLGDVLGLGLAWGAALLARRAPTPRHTYGWRRATLWSPLVNALLLVGFSGALAWEATRRLAAPPDIPPLPVIVVAALGIAVNLGAAWLVRGGHAQDLNRRGAFLHLLADAAVSLAAVLAGVGIWWLGWNWLDPAIAVLIAVVIAAGALGLLRESFDAAMDAVPRNIDERRVAGFLAGYPGVQAVHHLHVWALGTGEVALTAHLVRASPEGHDAFIDALSAALGQQFGINHPTLQVEYGQGGAHDCAHAAPHGAHPHDLPHDH